MQKKQTLKTKPLKKKTNKANLWKKKTPFEKKKHFGLKTTL